MTGTLYDLAIVGGGINGAGIAADAAGRGLKVLLAEMGDLAGATSSASSKLIHGGLRYLEHRQFRLVRESLAEREVLLAKAPHIIRPLRFVLPHVAGMRHPALIRVGLALYDRLAPRRVIPPSMAIDLRRDPAGRALRPELDQGFAYYDCWVDDARLVVLNARQAADLGATILTRTRVAGAAIVDGLWRVSLDDGTATRQIGARALVNAAGPWAGDVACSALHGSTAMQSATAKQSAGAKPLTLRLVKGSHIVVPRIAGAEDAYLMQSGDGRVVFALPFEQRFTLIGTTDVPFMGRAEDVAVAPEEETYLLDLANRFFAKKLAASDIVWRYSGVRPLVDDGSSDPSSISRDYRLDLAAEPGSPPLINVVGGKITTYRRLAEAALVKLEPYVRAARGPWTATEVLPGGDLGEGGIEGYRLGLAHRYPAIGMRLISRLATLYGTRAAELLGDAKSMADLGEHIGDGLTEREAAYLKASEWARTPDDILWRRTKTGLHLNDRQRMLASERLAALL